MTTQMPAYVRRRLEEHHRVEREAWREWNERRRGVLTRRASWDNSGDIMRRYVMAGRAIAAIEEEWREEAA